MVAPVLSLKDGEDILIQMKGLCYVRKIVEWKRKDGFDTASSGRHVERSPARWVRSVWPDPYSTDAVSTSALLGHHVVHYVRTACRSMLHAICSVCVACSMQMIYMAMSEPNLPHTISAPVFSASNSLAKTCRNCPARPQGDISSRSINSFSVSVTVNVLDDPRNGMTICPPCSSHTFGGSVSNPTNQNQTLKSANSQFAAKSAERSPVPRRLSRPYFVTAHKTNAQSNVQ